MKATKLNPKDTIELILKSLNLPYEKEYRFHPVRRFRFDFCVPALKIAIEYEGVFSDKSRHTSVYGYSEDTTKYNLATIEGWRVLRYTAKTVGNMPTEVEQLIKNVK